MCRSVGHEARVLTLDLTPLSGKSELVRDRHILVEDREPFRRVPRMRSFGRMRRADSLERPWLVQISGQPPLWAFFRSPQAFGAFGGKCLNIFSTPLSRFFVFLFGLLESVSLAELRQINFSVFASKRSISKVPTL